MGSIVGLILALVTLATFIIKRFFSKGQVKKRRGKKIMAIRQKMLDAKNRGDDGSWNQLNAEREKLLKDIYKGLQ